MSRELETELAEVSIATIDKTPALRFAIATVFVAAVLSDANVSTLSARNAPSGAASPPVEKVLSVYAPVATYSLPVLDRGGREYVGLLELLEPLGRINSQTSGPRWRIRYNAVEGEFTAGKIQAKVRGRDFDLIGPFLIENSRGLVPLASLGGLLPRFLGAQVSFHESGRRLFIGDVGVQPSFQVEPGAQPRLVLNFKAMVNPTISTEPGRVRMVFRRDPVLFIGNQSIFFADKVITQATYSETNGVAEIDVIAKSPLLATFSNGGKTITLSAAPTNSGAASAAASSPSPATRAATPTAATAGGASAGATSARRMLVLVDAAHGGDERGAALTDTLPEKDVTLGFARLLRHELETRGFAVVMSRDSDDRVSLDQRAGMANAAPAAACISLHAATSDGEGARVYSALLPREGSSSGIFHPWNSAQASALPMSEALASATVNELQKRRFSARASSASLRPLNNLLMPAIAVELAPGVNGVADLTSATYQQQAAAAIADAVASVRERLGVPQ